VSDPLAQLQGKRKAVGDFGVPTLAEFRRGHAVEGVVDLGRMKVFGVVGQILFRGKILRIEATFPFFVGKTRTPDKPFLSHS